MVDGSLFVSIPLYTFMQRTLLHSFGEQGISPFPVLSPETLHKAVELIFPQIVFLDMC